MVSVGTGDLLHGDTSGAEGPAQLLDRFEALEPRRAGKDVDVHRTRFRPRVEDGVRFAEDQDAGEAGPRKRVGGLVHNRAPAEIDRVEGGWDVRLHLQTLGGPPGRNCSKLNSYPEHDYLLYAVHGFR